MLNYARDYGPISEIGYNGALYLAIIFTSYVHTIDRKFSLFIRRNVNIATILRNFLEYRAYVMIVSRDITVYRLNSRLARTDIYVQHVQNFEISRAAREKYYVIRVPFFHHRVERCQCAKSSQNNFFVRKSTYNRCTV